MPEIDPQPGPDRGDDLYVSGQFPTTNYGNATVLRLKYTGVDAGWISALLYFDLSRVIGRGSEINSAALKVYFTDTHVSPPTYELARCKSGWVEDEADFQQSSDGIQWLGAFNANNPGLNDTTYAVSGTLPSSDGFVTFPSNKDLAQDVVDNHNSKLRVHIYSTSVSAINWWGFASSGHATAAWRPQLLVNFKQGRGASGYFAAAATGIVHPTSGW